jgi:hypothetical protein
MAHEETTIILNYLSLHVIPLLEGMADGSIPRDLANLQALEHELGESHKLSKEAVVSFRKGEE